jgi:osmotically-inducible protein OsmY
MASGDRWRSEQDRSGDRDDKRDRWRNERESRDYARGGRSGDYRGGYGGEGRGFGGGYDSEGRGFGVGEYGEGDRFGGYRGGEERGGIGGYGASREERRDFGRGYGESRGGYGGSGFGRDEYRRGGFERGPGTWSESRYGGGYGRESFGRGSQDWGSREYGRRGEERGFWERASDEVSSWFGDDEAERRRREDMRGRGPKNYTRSDDRIREDVNDRLSDDPFVDASEIEVQVSSCEVTLTGTVDSREAKRRAEDIAERVSGVKHVQNNLRVNQPGTGGAWVGTSTALGTAARPDLVRTKGSPDDFVTGNTTPDAAQRDTGDVPGPGLGSV